MKKLNEYPFFLDGAMGSRLLKAGMPKGSCAELWAIENSGIVIDIQRGYAGAGSDAVLAPTFGANRAALKAHGAGHRVRELNSTLVGISRQAVGDMALVGGDMAPTGLQTPPMGMTDFEELVDIFSEQAQALDEAGVDFLCIETQMSLQETRAAVTAAQSVSSKPIFVSFSTESGKTIYGGDLISALVCLEDLGIDAFGINCCGNLELIESLLRKMRVYTDLPLIAKPNAGMPEYVNGAAVYAMEPDQLGQKTPELIKAGAGILGGCCGTDERHIAAMHEASRSVMAEPRPESAIRNLCASERCVLELNVAPRIRDLDLTEDIIEDAACALDEGVQLLSVKIIDETGLDILYSNQYGIALPLCVECVDKELLRRFKRVYCGKPLIV